MTQDTLNLFLASFLIVYLGVVAVVLTLAAFDERQAQRRLALGDHLHDLAQNAVTRYTWAKNGTNRDEWIVLDRAMQDLEGIVEEWGEANGEPE